MVEEFILLVFNLARLACKAAEFAWSWLSLQATRLRYWCTIRALRGATAVIRSLNHVLGLKEER